MSKALETKIIVFIIATFIAVVLVVGILAYFLGGYAGLDLCLYLTEKFGLLKFFPCYELFGG